MRNEMLAGLCRLGLTTAMVAVLLAAPGAATPNAGPRQPALGRAGTALGPGFTVAAGSNLVGTVFPRVSLLEVYAPAVDGWTAVLELEGDPVEVFNAYLRQATAAGFDAAGTCGQLEDTTSTTLRRDARGIGCSGTGYVIEGEWTVEAVSIELRRSARKAPYESHVLVRVSRFAPGGYGRQATLGAPQVPPDSLAEPGSRPSASPPPEAGEVIVRDRFKKPFKVVGGTRALTTPVGAHGQFDMVLKVTGDLEAVLDRYERRAKERRLPTYRTEAVALGREFVALQAGGDSAEIFEATAVLGPGREPTFLLLSLIPS